MNFSQYVVTEQRFHFNWHLCVISNVKEKEFCPLKITFRNQQIYGQHFLGQKARKSHCAILKFRLGGEPHLVLSGSCSSGTHKTDTIVMLSLTPENGSQKCGLLAMTRSPFSEPSRIEVVIFIITRLLKSRNSSHPWPNEAHVILQLRVYWKLSLCIQMQI